MESQKNNYKRTPILNSKVLSEKLAKDVYLKLENLQPSGSFKMRGVDFLCQHEHSKGINHFVSSSAGNAGFSVASVAKLLGAQSTIFVPENTTERIVNILESANANVKIIGASWDDAHKAALEFTSLNQASYIHPFDHPLLWQGHSSLIEESVSEIEKPDAIILSVGGGGLLSGVFEGLQKVNWQDVPIIAVETKGADSLNQSVSKGELVLLEAITSVAKSLGARQVSKNALRLVQDHNVASIVVSDQAALSACYKFYRDHKHIVEPSCGAALSVLYDNHSVLANKKSVLAIVCGGILSTKEDVESWQFETTE